MDSRSLTMLALALATGCAHREVPPSTDRVLAKELSVPAPPSEVWNAWTTVEGVKTFFSPAARIEPRTGGAYEMYFAPDLPEGARGSEGCTIVTFNPDRELAFTWNFPPSLPSIRHEHTIVRVQLRPEGIGTRVLLEQTGWKGGPEWERGYAYFDRVWGGVLERLAQRFRTGPMDWGK